MFLLSLQSQTKQNTIKLNLNYNFALGYTHTTALNVPRFQVFLNYLMSRIKTTNYTERASYAYIQERSIRATHGADDISE